MELGEQINKIYEKRTFVEKFGNDIIFAIVIGIILIGINVYFYVINNLKGLKNQWKDIKCDPLYMPFASIINPPTDGTTNLKYIEENAQQCVNKNLGGEAEFLTNPIKAILDTLIETLKGIVETLIEFIVIMGKFADSIILIFSKLYMSISESIKVNNGIFENITNVLSTFSSVVAVFGYVGESFSLFGTSLLNSLGKCFDKNTIMLMKSGNETKISDIKVGDELLYDGCVTGIMKLSSNKVQMYQYNGIIVSGSHYVYEGDTIKKIEDCDSSIPCDTYNETEIYCICTESKQIHLNNVIFADYDDLSPRDCIYLKQWISNKYSIPRVKNYDIHKYMNGGLLDTTIKMQNGNSKMLSEIEIDDILDNNIKVLGIVKLYPKDIQLKRLLLENKEIIGGSNIQIMDKYKQYSLNAIDAKEIVENNQYE